MALVGERSENWSRSNDPRLSKQHRVARMVSIVHLAQPICDCPLLPDVMKHD